jgi:hypothetical protein
MPEVMYRAGLTRYREPLKMRRSVWRLIIFSLVATWFTVGFFYTIALVLIWVIQSARFSKRYVEIDEYWVRVGRKRLPLKALDPSTLGRASNPWPWRQWSKRWVQCDPVWSSDSVGMRGTIDGKTVWLGVGTEQRDELVAALLAAIDDAKRAEGLPLRPPRQLPSPTPFWEVARQHRDTNPIGRPS